MLRTVVIPVAAAGRATRRPRCIDGCKCVAVAEVQLSDLIAHEGKERHVPAEDVDEEIARRLPGCTVVARKRRQRKVLTVPEGWRKQ